MVVEAEEGDPDEAGEREARDDLAPQVAAAGKQ